MHSTPNTYPAETGGRDHLVTGFPVFVFLVLVFGLHGIKRLSFFWMIPPFCDLGTITTSTQSAHSLQVFIRIFRPCYE